MAGIKVTAGSTYTASFFYRFPATTSFQGNVVVGLQTTSGQVLVSASTAISGAQTSWQQITVTLRPTTTPSSTANIFTITLDGAAASGQNINFAMLSLFPPTFKNRPNGMRADIATVRQTVCILVSFAEIILGTRRDGPRVLPFPRYESDAEAPGPRLISTPRRQ